MGCTVETLISGSVFGFAPVWSSGRIYTESEQHYGLLAAKFTHLLKEKQKKTSEHHMLKAFRTYLNAHRMHGVCVAFGLHHSSDKLFQTCKGSNPKLWWGPNSTVFVCNSMQLFMKQNSKRLSKSWALSHT